MKSWPKLWYKMVLFSWNIKNILFKKNFIDKFLKNCWNAVSKKSNCSINSKTDQNKDCFRKIPKSPRPSSFLVWNCWSLLRWQAPRQTRVKTITNSRCFKRHPTALPYCLNALNKFLKTQKTQCYSCVEQLKDFLYNTNNFINKISDWLSYLKLTN